MKSRKKINLIRIESQNTRKKTPQNTHNKMHFTEACKPAILMFLNYCNLMFQYTVILKSQTSPACD